MLPTFVTGNLNKVKYLNEALGFELAHTPLNLTEVQPEHNDPREVMEYKVREAYQQLKVPVLVEDTSLTFNALTTLPGPLVKAFVYMDPKEMDANLENMCRILDGFDDRTAFGSAIYGYFDGHETKFFTGRLEGVISEHPRGNNGYGWDAIFEPVGYNGLTRAELDTEPYMKAFNTIRDIAGLRAFLQTLKDPS